MNVMSLFDGIACCRIALERANIAVDKYYASETDSKAIQVATTNYEDIIEIGDIRYVDTKLYKDIDLITFGSPCTNFSTSGKLNGMTTTTNIVLDSLEKYLECKEDGYVFEGESYLFWEAIRILRDIKPKYFLMENVKMTANWLNIVTEALGVEPVMLNSSLVSAQNRMRFYWTNIPFDREIKDKGIKLQDIIEDKIYLYPASIRGRQFNENGKRINKKGVPYVQCLEVKTDSIEKSNCLTTAIKDSVLTSFKSGSYVDVKKNNFPYRYFTRTEYERLQTITEGYTDCVSYQFARKLVGNAWTVDIIAHIFKGLVG